MKLTTSIPADIYCNFLFIFLAMPTIKTIRETNIRGNETINKVKAGLITRKMTNIINRTRAAGITTLFRLVILRSTFPL
jgi:hypothetical protein